MSSTKKGLGLAGTSLFTNTEKLSKKIKEDTSPSLELKKSSAHFLKAKTFKIKEIHLEYIDSLAFFKKRKKQDVLGDIIDYYMKNYPISDLRK